MKKTIAILSLALVFSCKNHTENQTTKTSQTDTLAVKKDTITKSITEAEEQSEDIEKPYSESKFRILLPLGYRDYEGKNKTEILDKTWLDLHEKNGKFYLDKADYTMEEGYDECAGYPTKIIKSNRKTMILIENKGLEEGEIQSVEITKNEILPKEKISFQFNGDTYTLRGEGKILSSENVSEDNGVKVFHNVGDYKLFLSVNDKDETLIIKEDTFNDTFVKLLFVGDVDRDGKLDFIFNANRDYEEERILLFLSSEAENHSKKRKVAEGVVQFDC